jgi:hypothetical protein
MLIGCDVGCIDGDERIEDTRWMRWMEIQGLKRRRDGLCVLCSQSNDTFSHISDRRCSSQNSDDSTHVAVEAFFLKTKRQRRRKGVVGKKETEKKVYKFAFVAVGGGGSREKQKKTRKRGKQGVRDVKRRVKRRSEGSGFALQAK